MRDEFAVVFKEDPERKRPPVFEGDRVETLVWLKDRATDNGTLQVYDKDLREYFDTAVWLKQHGIVAAPTTMSPDERMLYEELHDPFVHARNHMVHQYIARALRVVNEPHYDAELLAKNTAHDVIRLFY